MMGNEAALARSDQKPPPPDVMVNETPSWVSSWPTYVDVGAVRIVDDEPAPVAFVLDQRGEEPLHLGVRPAPHVGRRRVRLRGGHVGTARPHLHLHAVGRGAGAEARRRLGQLVGRLVPRPGAGAGVVLAVGSRGDPSRPTSPCPRPPESRSGSSRRCRPACGRPGACRGRRRRRPGRRSRRWPRSGPRPSMLRLDVNGRPWPLGHAVRKPDALDSVAVRLATTEPMPPVSPSAAAGVTLRELPAVGLGPERVSSARAGVTGTNKPSLEVGAEPSVNHPATSTTTCDADSVNSRTRPLASTGTMAKLARVAPAWSMLTFDTVGAPSGVTVRNPASTGLRHRQVHGYRSRHLTPARRPGRSPGPPSCRPPRACREPARPVPLRLSTRRAGAAADTYRPAFERGGGQ